jgi:8-oxo-dGTP pyrophosphatase MutT (NUDIX family)
MQECTLCFLIDESRNTICLGYKKRGFGLGKWNGAGGKVHDGEAVEVAMLRELQEEFGVEAEREHLEKVGVLEFFYETNTIQDVRGHVFLIRQWSGEPSESDEMRPVWFDVDKIPFENMWEDVAHWLLEALQGKKIQSAQFTFDADQKLKNIDKIKFIS